jgi:transcriptional regulator with XRE-family HTH domain
MKKTTPYGALLRERRVQANLSLREVAEHVGVSHVYLAEIERGVSGPLKLDREPKLLEAMPNVAQIELSIARAASTYKITPATTPPKYMDMTAALARRIERDNLSDTKVRKILELLKDGDD